MSQKREGNRMDSSILRRVAPFVVSVAVGCGTADERPEAVTEQLGSEQSALHGPPVTIKIGALDDPSTTTLYGDAIRLAVKQMNQALKGLHSNVRFQVVFGDDQGNNAAVALSETLRLLNQEHVLAMVSDSSGDTIAVNRLNYDPASEAPYQFPVVCYQCSNGLINNPTATDPNAIAQAALRDEQNWLFRLFYNANFEAKVIDQIILSKPNQGDRNGDGLVKISVYADAGHTSLANALGPTLSLYYGGATSTEVILTGTPEDYAADWPRVVDTLNETTGAVDGEPDYVVLAMLPVRVAPAVQAYRAGGFTLPVISNNSFRRNYILPLVGPGANGLEGSSVALANSNLSGDLFIRAFTRAYGEGPEQTSSGAYDSVTTLMLASLVAARDVGGAQHVTPTDIRNALPRINNPRGIKIRPSVTSFGIAALAARARLAINYDGAYDADDWDAAGDIFPPLVHWTVVDNQFVESEAYLCNPTNPLCPVQ
jgi:ABC-type branched-subunit amino acid transport system substrate-binding protein